MANSKIKNSVDIEGSLDVSVDATVDGNLTVSTDLTVTGDLTVNGTTTTINTANLAVEDANIVVNSGGNNASAEGAGITVERTGTDGAIVYEDALPSKFKAGAAGSEIELVNVSSTQDLSNKTLVSPSIEGPATLENQGSTPSNPSAGFIKLYSKTDDKLYKLNSAGLEEEVGTGAGGGSGGINYIDNSDAETDAAGWDAYADAAGVSPVDGSGGSPSVTITRSTSSPLRGTGSLLLTKDASNRQGEGASYDFTIDDADLSKLLTITFDYEVSTNFAAGDSSDVRIWVYDVTNATLIQPSPYTIQGATSSSHRFIASFQAASNSNSYRLIFHVATTNANAWTFKFDNVSVGPELVNYNAQVVDLGIIDVTLDNVTTSNRNFAFTRIGHLMQCFGSFNVSSSSGSPFAIVLPNSLNLDTSKIVSNQFVGKFEQLTGTVQLYASGGETNVNVFYDGSDTTKLFLTASLSAGTPVKLNGSSLSNVQHRVIFTVPIAEWETAPAAVTAKETIAAIYNTAAGQSFANVTTTIIDFGTSEHDTHGSVTSGANWKFTAPYSGIYNVSAIVTFAGVASDDGTNYQLQLFKNGSLAKYLNQTPKQTNSAVELGVQGSTLIKLTAGEYIDVRLRQNSSVTRSITTDADQNHISIHRI